MFLGTYMLAQRCGCSASAAACIDKINQGNCMHLHIEELFHQQEQYAPTAHVKRHLAKPRSVARKRLDHILGGFSEAVENFHEPVLYELIFNLPPGFQVQMKQGSAEVIPFARGSWGEQA